MAEGIRKRHSKGCSARKGGRCNCKAGWEASVYIAREGRKLRRSFVRESEAKAWRRDALAEAESGQLRSPSAITLEQAAWLWLGAARTGAVRDRSGHLYKPGTLREYGRVLSLRGLPKFGHVRLAELTRADVQGFVDEMLTEGLASSTIRNTIKPFQAIYRHAVRRELVSVNPTREVDLPVARGRRERIATASEAARLLAALPDSDRPIWATAFYAGLRRGELQALRCCDIDLKRGEITVERSWDQHEGPISPKSRAGTRTVPVLGVLRGHLEALDLANGTDLAFGRGTDLPFAPSAVDKRAKRAWETVNAAECEAATTDDREAVLVSPMTLHECRHTFASLLIDAGVNAKAIQEFMGHGTIEETFSRYGHLMPGARDHARQLVDAYMVSARTAA
ncbi:MAG TPA: tyrosine-type recombinase/integrase [Solirubrobacterales bacterium]|nr:tyrosine-type recombinase/integrase [Solirubrobacterales bacterium]